MFRFSSIKSKLQAAVVGYQIQHRTWRDGIGACEHRFTFDPIENVRGIHYELFEIQKGGFLRPKETRYCLRNLNTRLYKFYGDVEDLLCDLQVILNRQRKPTRGLSVGY